MKKLYMAIIVIFSATLIFFTIFGNMIYDNVTPHVKSSSVGKSMYKDKDLYVIPASAIVDEKYVYIINSYQGFSRYISNVEKKEIVVAEETSYNNEDVYVIEGIKEIDTVVSKYDRELTSGEKVIVE